MVSKETECPIIWDITPEKDNCPIIWDWSLIRNSVNFVVPGPPFGKQRPKFARRGKFVSTYTPKETVEYENKVRRCYLDKYPDTKLRIPVRADIKAYFKIPKNTPKKKQKLMLEEKLIPTTKPDSDNIGKACLDPLNKVTYEDDAGVSSLLVEKFYSIIPRVEIKIKEI